MRSLAWRELNSSLELASRSASSRPEIAGRDVPQPHRGRRRTRAAELGACDADVAEVDAVEHCRHRAGMDAPHRLWLLGRAMEESEALGVRSHWFSSMRRAEGTAGGDRFPWRAPDGLIGTLATASDDLFSSALIG